MNKTIALLILGVIVLAMALIMVNQFMSPPSSPVAVEGTAPSAENGQGNAFRADVAQPVPGKQPVAPAPAEEPAAAAPATPHAPSLPAWAGPSVEKSPLGAPPHAASVPPAMPQAASSSALGQSPMQPAPQTTPDPVAPPQAAPVETTAPTKAAPAAAAKPAPAKSTSTAAAKPAQSKAAPAAPAKPKGPKTVNRIVVSAADGGSLVRINASEAMEYKTMHLKGPDRLVVDLAGVWAVKAPGVPANKYVSNVRIGKQSDKTRIVIDLRQTPQGVNYVKRGADTLEVRIK